MRTVMVEAYKRFEIHDGPGVRTTVFLKGCPLVCRWCHNPECIRMGNDIAYHADRCISCGECVKACPAGAHSIKNGLHHFDREKCMLCGKCMDVCTEGAMHIHGRQENADDVLKKVLEDRMFYGTNGGVTISGGEPLLNSEFVAEVFKKLKEEGIHTALDTCLYASEKALETVLPYTDLFLADLKAIDENVHIRATGKSCRVILDNFRWLSGKGASIEIRIPFVPGYNDDQMEKMADFICSLNGITGVKILPYHDYAAAKYRMLGEEQEKIRVPDQKEIEDARRTLLSRGINVL